MTFRAVISALGLFITFTAQAGVIQCEYNTRNGKPLVAIWGLNANQHWERVKRVYFDTYEERNAALAKCEAVMNDWNIDLCSEPTLGRKNDDLKTHVRTWPCAHNLKTNETSAEDVFGSTHNGELKYIANQIADAIQE